MKVFLHRCCIALFFLVNGAASSSSCNVTSNVDPSKWPKVPTIPSSFKTNIEINLVDQRSTMDAVLYFDNFGNRAALYTVKEGLNGVSVYDFPSNQVFYVTNGVCLVANITDRAEADLFGITETDGYYHVMQSSTVLKFGDQYNETYIGTDTVRGITVDHWRSCLHWKKYNGNFTVDYYFSKANAWVTSSDFLQVPVRANVTGVYINDGGAKSISHVYDFNAFTGSLDVDDAATVFETPTGVICKGRKKTKPVPDLPRQFYYRQEISLDNIVTYYDVWYFEKYHYLRYDYRPIRPFSPFFTTNPVTEVLDYNTGVRYFMDNGYGNCSILPLEKTSFGAKLFLNANQTGYFKLDIENPMDLFYLDKNYTYVGTRHCRDMICDVYSAIRRNLVIGGQLDPANTTIEMYILQTDTVVIYPEHGDGKPPDVVPVMMTMLADSLGFSETIHFFDFDSDAPDFSVFDVSSCYNDMSQLQFSVKFPGRFVKDRVDTLKQLAQLKFAMAMGIEITRLQHFKVDVDYADIYVRATLLDRLPASPQFNYMGSIEVLDQGDMDVGKVATPMECAEMCIAVSNFTCNSFDFCSQDPQRTCRLNRQHISDGLRTKTNTTCGHFSRTADGPPQQDKTILEAYQALRLAVYRKQLTLQIEMDNQEMAYYLAVDTSIEFGAAKPTKLPMISAQFSYDQEVVIPSLAQVFQSKVWYNSNSKLVRYDYHDNKPTAPYYTANPMTMIHDFNTGLQYVIDKIFDNCTISPISPGQFDAELDRTDYLKDHSYIVQMKNPLELFHTDNQIKFVGQKTIRNVLCDVFMGLDQNYYVPGINGTQAAVLEFYFLTGGWSEVGKDDDSRNTFTPMKLDITIAQKGLFFTYNFFNFEVDEPNTYSATDLFNTQKCFSDTQQHRFQIKFPGQFHPILDIYQGMFLMETVTTVAEAAGVNPLRVQAARLDHDEDNIYFTATLLDKAPSLAQFTRINGQVMAHKTTGFYVGVSTPEECAQACVETSSFPCNGFDICASVKYCFVSSNHTSNGPTLSNGTICDHYSRTVNALPEPTPDLYTAYINLKNDVYSNVINIKIPGQNDTVKEFIASTIRDTIEQTNVPQGGKSLRSFDLYKNNMIYQNNDEKLENVAIDDCATACLMEELFDCQSFEYCPGIEVCYLSRVQPDNTTKVVPSDSCDLYSRIYLDQYNKYPGIVFSTPGYRIVQNITTDNQCARQCTMDSLCKSFDYCPNTNLCTLRNTHKLDMSNDTIISSATCNHFSRKYISDFVIKYGRNMMIDSTHEVVGITADQCAKLCIDQETTECKSFIYCANQTTCQLKTTLPGQAPIVASQYCDLYTRSYSSSAGCNASSVPIIPHYTSSSPFTSPNPIQITSTVKSSVTSKQATVTPRKTTRVNTQTSGVRIPTSTQKAKNNSFCTPQKDIETLNNPGVLVGVAFGVFILGLIFGGVISYFLFKKYSIRSDDMTMQLMNNN